MPNHYLTKSDFKLGRQCPQKVYYRKLKYPSRFDEDRYLHLLAEGGYMVGELAKMMYPDGIDIDTLDIVEAHAQTIDLMKRDRVILFEPAIVWDSYLIRVDVLIKTGDELHLIEVKSKSARDPGNGGYEIFLTGKGRVRSEWRPYLEDCAFQAFVLRNAFPSSTVRTSLLLPDRDSRCPVEGLPAQLKLHRHAARRGPTVTFTGDRAEAGRSRLLKQFPVDPIVAALSSEIATAAADLSQYVRNGIRNPRSPIGYRCHDCEYNHSNGNGRNGFNECWNSLADVSPHMFQLYRLGNVKRPDKSLTADHLIRRGRVSLHDIPAEDLNGGYGFRQKIQIARTRTNEELVAPALAVSMGEAVYPLHFIDFETSRTAIPPHAGMRPYELIAFQWSCHVMNAPGAAPRHADWIHTEEVFPNLQFVESLRQCIGDHGTLVVWSPYEKAVLAEISRQLKRQTSNPLDTIAWLDALVANESRFLDMLDLTHEHYYHPSMKGSNSIKSVLPAIWASNPPLRRDPWFSKYAADPLDPYRTLPSIEIAAKAERVEEGTGAIRAYQDMLYGEHQDDPEVRQAWTRLLRQYCELDTMAMVIIWKHWQMRLGIRQEPSPHR